MLLHIPAVSSSLLATNYYHSHTCSSLPSSICLLHSSCDSSSYLSCSAAALIMARVPVQLSMQLSISIMMLSCLSSIFLSLSDAARADTFTKGLDPPQKKNPAPMPRMRWLTAGVSAESFDGKLPVVQGPDVYSRSAVWSSSNEADSQSANEMRNVGERELSSNFEAEERRRGPVQDIVGNSHVTGNIDQLQRESPRMAKSFRGFRSSARLANDEIEDEHLQLLLNQKVALMSRADIPPLGMWLITDDEEGSFRSTALVLAAVLGADIDRDAEVSTEEIFSHLKEMNLPKRQALQADISPPGMSQGNDDQLDANSGKRTLLADISPPGIWTDAEVVEGRFQKRSLLADISPPGMWSDDGDDMQDKYHKRRLLADISPPGMWQGSDDQLTDMARK